MVTRVRWSTLARKQLQGIHGFYKQNSEITAKKLTSKIQEEVEGLVSFEFMGQIVTPLADEATTYRSLLVVDQLFRVVYYVDEDADEVVIVTVMNCRQNPEKLKADVEAFNRGYSNHPEQQHDQRDTKY
jgi:plasmid stabilization system protein ParE